MLVHPLQMFNQKVYCCIIPILNPPYLVSFDYLFDFKLFIINFNALQITFQSVYY